MATQKKTAEGDYSMQEKILALYELQKIDSNIKIWKNLLMENENYTKHSII